MKFSDHTKRQARLRQWGRCAHCGEKLDDLWEHAHHIYPHSLGGADRVDNCVILCENCHYYVHNYGHYQEAMVSPRSVFKYFNGGR